MEQWSAGVLQLYVYQEYSGIPLFFPAEAGLLIVTLCHF